MEANAKHETSQGCCIPVQGWTQSCMDGIYELQKAGNLCDTMLIIEDGVTFPVHSCILASSSSSLAEQLRSTVKVETANGEHVLPLQTSCEKVANVLIRFMYTGTLSCESHISSEVLRLAETLGITPLVTVLKEQFCQSELHGQLAPLSYSDPESEVSWPKSIEAKIIIDPVAVVEISDCYKDGTESLPTKHKIENVIGAEDQDTRVTSAEQRHFASPDLPSSTPGPEGGSVANLELPDASEGNLHTLDTKTRRTSRKRGRISTNFKRRSKRAATQPVKEEPNKATSEEQQVDIKKPKPPKRQRKSSRQWTCTICGKVLKKLTALRKHERFHERPTDFTCEHCNKKFPSKTQLKSHVMKHTGERPFQCKYCGKTYRTTSTLDTHERYFCRLGKLKGETQYCEKCGVSFWSKRCLEDHECKALLGIRSEEEAKHIHGVTMYKCHLCPKTFPRIQGYKAHQETHTQRAMSHGCPICNQQFMYKQGLIRHEKTHRGQKDFKCVFCGKTFYTLGECKQHERVHTKERPFKCSICNKTFSSQSALKVHGRRHSNERNYQCKTCGKRFVDMGHLRRHEDTHNNHLPYKCYLCQQPFRRQDNLRRHILNMHKNPSENMPYQPPNDGT